MTQQQFAFGDKVSRIGSDEVFVVLGIEPNGMVQIARFNHKTATKASDLARAGAA